MNSMLGQSKWQSFQKTHGLTVCHLKVRKLTSHVVSNCWWLNVRKWLYSPFPTGCNEFSASQIHPTISCPRQTPIRLKYCTYSHYISLFHSSEHNCRKHTTPNTCAWCIHWWLDWLITDAVKLFIYLFVKNIIKKPTLKSLYILVPLSQ